MKDFVAEVSRGEIELLVIAGVVGDVHLAVFAEVGAVGIDDGGGVVVEPFGTLFKHGADDDHPQFFGEGHEVLSGGSLGDGFGKGEVLIALFVAEIKGGKKLLEANDLRTVGGKLTNFLCVALDVGGFVGHATHLGDSNFDFVDEIFFFHNVFCSLLG